MTLEDRIHDMEVTLSEKLGTLEARVCELVELVEIAAQAPLTVGQIAEALGCHTGTVQQYFRQGLLKNVGTPRRYKASRKEVAELCRVGVREQRMKRYRTGAVQSSRELAHD